MRYVTLDLMRGLAALVVLLFHINYMLGSETHLIAKGYLAVDFFFILSGFVIAANYHVSVRPTLTRRDFISARIARLWPLFLLATLAGCVAVTMKATRDFGYFDAQNVVASLFLNILMLPSPLQAFGIDRLFFFNGASWSVFLEMAINLVFLVVLRRLPLKPLLFLAACFALVLAGVAWVHGSLDGGWSSANFYVGVARVLFGFTAGMVVYLVSVRRTFRLGSSATTIAVAGLALSFSIDGGWIAECVLVIAIYPLLVLLAAAGQLGPRTARIGGWLGDISYSVYLLQTPAMMAASWACPLLTGRKIAEFAPWSGIAFAVALLGLSYLCWRGFELPARRILRAWLASAPRRKVPATEGAA